MDQFSENGGGMLPAITASLLTADANSQCLRVALPMSSVGGGLRPANRCSTTFDINVFDSARLRVFGVAEVVMIGSRAHVFPAKPLMNTQWIATVDDL